MQPIFRFLRPAVVAAAAALITLVSASDEVVRAQSGKARDVIAETTIRAHMEFLAGDALAGRGSGTRDEWIAAAYIGSQLQRWGIEPLGDDGGYVQAIETTRGDLVAPPVISAGERIKIIHGKDAIVQTIGALQASGPLVKFSKGATIPAGAVVLVLSTDAPDAASVATAAAVLSPETGQIRARWDTLAATIRVTPQPGRPWRVALDAKSYLALVQSAEGTLVTLDANVKPDGT